MLKERPKLRILLVLGGIVAIGIVIGIGYAVEWMGFGRSVTRVGDNEDLRRAKTLWDWLQLLVVPVALVIGGFWLNRTQSKNERKAQEAQRERELEIEENRAQDVALEAYLDRMDELLLEKSLRTSNEGDEVRASARGRTITVLSRLGPNRKASVLKFIYEAGLINRGSAVVSLKDADLRGANLYAFKLVDADLGGANLSGANLSYADLSRAELTFTKFRRTNLRRARLRNAHMPATSWQRANLERADLEEANLVNAQMVRANLTGARLDGALLKGVTNLDRSVMREVNATGTDFSGARLFSADLTQAYLYGAVLQRTRFTPHWSELIDGTDDRSTMEHFARLGIDEEDLKRSDLKDADLTRAVLDNTDLFETRITDQQLSSCASLKGASLPPSSKLNDTAP